MELEFDKEIDAILRRARETRGVLVGDGPAKPKKHLDADIIAAFAENALPEKSKILYTEHFANCDRCRKLLSQNMLMNMEAASSVKESASVLAAPVAEASAPWFPFLFKTQNLALVMGGLVLVFTGALGYIMLQSRNAATNSSVSQITEPQLPQSGPNYSGESTNAAANSAGTANTSSRPYVANTDIAPYEAPADQAPATSTERQSTPSNSTPSNTKTGSSDRLDTNEEKKAEKDAKTSAVGGATVAPPKPALAKPPLADLPVNGRSMSETVVIDGVAGKNADLSKLKQTENRRETRDVPAPASKVGPSRSGPVQTQSNQLNNGAYEMSVKRTVNGKTFENRSGAWYDSAYHGQATKNVRRGTDEYRRLDTGVRNIANTLGGTVVLVWKEKAYRIQ